jgi:hypothetical protein
MMTKTELITAIKSKHPVLQSGSDETGYEVMSSQDYEKTINDWADAQIAKQEAEAATLLEKSLKVSAYQKLGLTEAEIEALLPTNKLADETTAK